MGIVFFLGGLLFLSACTLPWGEPRLNHVRLVELSAGKGINEDTAVAVDVVFVYDPVWVERFAGLSAAEWFAQKEKWLLDSAGSIAVVSQEMMSAYTVPRLALPEHSGRAVQVLVYANYLNPGMHRSDITGRKRVRIALGQKSFFVEDY